MERVSGLSLNDYFQKNIFKPMGLQAINFFPTDHMKQNLAYMHARAPDGKLSLRLNGQLLRKPLTAQTPRKSRRLSTLVVQDVLQNLQNTARSLQPC